MTGAADDVPTARGEGRLSVDQWRLVFDAADRALELPQSERAAFVDSVISADRSVGRQVRALLNIEDNPSPLDTPASEFAAPLFDDAPAGGPYDAPTGSSFGPYRIIRELGRGGMGAVYLAERSDKQYEKQVALKVLPLLSVGNTAQLNRFLEERQILAGLDHPGIARLTDGGVTEEGVPWFAMELVKGEEIDRYCDDRNISIEQRLNLFRQVCEAVQYAHRNLVIHRDLKPGNILVTPEGQVKLLDFGIATLLGEHARELDFTRAHTLTPLFASPEQIRGEAVSTASDVYALGVLLCVLLAGRDPYPPVSGDNLDITRMVLNEQPLKPSQILQGATGEKSHDLEEIAKRRNTTVRKLLRRLQGDLDAIVLKALQKGPSLRYATVEQLETEVRRHLASLPVLARRSSRLYNAGKFVLRHKLGVAATAGVAAVMLGFVAVTGVQLSRIRQQSARIALERDRALAANSYVITLFQGTAQVPSFGPTTETILDSAASRIDHAENIDALQRGAVKLQIARAYLAVGLIERARKLVESAHDLYIAAPPQHDMEIAESAELLGGILLAERAFPEAERSYREALARRGQAPGRQNGPISPVLLGLASSLREQKHLDEAELTARRAVAIDRARTAGAGPYLAASTRVLGRVMFDRREFRSAASLFKESLSLLRAIGPEENPDVASAIFDLAAVTAAAGDHATADSLVRYANALHQRLVTAVALRRSGDALADGRRTDDSVTRSIARVFALTAPGNRQSTAAETPFRIAFSSDRDGPDPHGDFGNSEIYVMNADGSGQRRLTVNPGVDMHATWSPDGRKIAFASQRDGMDIYTINPDGTGETRLTNLSALKLGATEPAWSPDGKRVAFQSQLTPDIYIINADGTGLKQLTDHPRADGSPAWSPDGRQIAFASRRDLNAEIYVMSVDGGDPVRLTNTKGNEAMPAWSPDGRQIIFNSNRDGDQEIYVMNSDGTNVKRLTFNPGPDACASFSRDGRRIIFHHRVLGHMQVFSMKPDGSDQRRLTELSLTAYNGFASAGPP